MNGTNLTPGQIIAIGVVFLFGPPIAIGLVVGHFFGFGPGAVSAGLVLVVIVWIAQRWMKKTGKQDKED